MNVAERGMERSMLLLLWRRRLLLRERCRAGGIPNVGCASCRRAGLGDAMVHGPGAIIVNALELLFVFHFCLYLLGVARNLHYLGMRTVAVRELGRSWFQIQIRKGRCWVGRWCIHDVATVA